MPIYTLKLISCRKVIWSQPGSIPGIGTKHKEIATHGKLYCEGIRDSSNLSFVFYLIRMYTLCLINSRKVNWLHRGSIPLFRTIIICFKINKMATITSKPLKCTCVHEFQDQTYGPQMRLHSKMKQKVSTDKTWRCTVCEKEREGGLASSNTSSEVKGKKK